jgi:hypothetical protein
MKDNQARNTCKNNRSKEALEPYSRLDEENVVENGVKYKEEVDDAAKDPVVAV